MGLTGRRKSPREYNSINKLYIYSANIMTVLIKANVAVSKSEHFLLGKFIVPQKILEGFDP